MYPSHNPSAQAELDAMLERGRRAQAHRAEVDRQREIDRGVTTAAELTGDLNGGWIAEAVESQLDGLDEDTAEAIRDDYAQALRDAAWEHRITWDVWHSSATYPAHQGIDVEARLSEVVGAVDVQAIIARHVEKAS